MRNQDKESKTLTSKKLHRTTEFRQLITVRHHLILEDRVVIQAVALGLEMVMAMGAVMAMGTAMEMGTGTEDKQHLEGHVVLPPLL